MLPNNLAANIGLAQLAKIDDLQTRRKEIWEFYSENLKGKIKISQKPGFGMTVSNRSVLQKLPG